MVPFTLTMYADFDVGAALYAEWNSQLADECVRISARVVSRAGVSGNPEGLAKAEVT
jgi:hypothetical protein